MRRLAATVLYAMNKKYQLGIDPEAQGIHDGKFYGAHLRTAADAASAGWTPYSTQSSHYLSHASHNHLPLIYVASGSPPDILLLSQDAANYSFPMEVTTKSLLFAEKGFEKEKDEMEGLTWDQQALVDYEVLLRASRFGGTWESSFGWNLAMRRHVAMGRGDWIPFEQEKTGPSGSSKAKGESNASSWNPSQPATTKKPGNNKEADGEVGPATKVFDPDTATEMAVGEGPRPTVYPLGQGRRGVETRMSKRQLPTGQQAFSDAYSIIFGDVTPGNHPGVVFELALWP